MADIVIAETSGSYTPCQHVVHIPVFNAEACRYFSSEQVREKYPRFDGICTLCNHRCIIYANLTHAKAGEWI